MDAIRYISWRGNIEANREKFRAAQGEFYIYETSYRPPKGYPFKMDDYGCSICLEGTTSGSIDLRPYTLRPSCMSVNLPEQLLEQGSMSRDFKGICIVMSRSFVRSLGLPYNFELDKMLRDAPIIELQPPQLEAILSYCRMVRQLLERERPFQMETLRHLTCAFLYGLGSYLFQLSANRHLSGDEQLTQNLLKEISVFFRKERQIPFYAQRLGISVGHLHSVVRRVSGRSPGEWIEQYVTKEACAMLKGTNLTIQQISIELGFPSQSFFGKYFKRIIGLSPKEYREKI